MSLDGVTTGQYPAPEALADGGSGLSVEVSFSGELAEVHDDDLVDEEPTEVGHPLKREPESEFGPSSERRVRTRDPEQEGAVWATPEAKALEAMGKWVELIELHLEQLEATTRPRGKARIFRRISEIFARELDDASQAFDALLEAVSADPEDDETVRVLEDVTRKNDKWSALILGMDEALKEPGDVARATRICEHVIRWHTQERNTPDLAEAYLAKIRKLDHGHPLVQREVAASYERKKSWGLAREALRKALDRSHRHEDKVSFNVELGELCESRLKDTGEATRYYEAALALDSGIFAALLGLERILRSDQKFAELEDVLARQIRATPAREAEIASRIRLGDLLEKNLVKPHAAAQILEPILELEPSHEIALIALERCYLAMRAWPELVRTLEVRERFAKDPSDRAEVMFRIAEVMESKIGDVEGAILAYRRIFDFDKNSQIAISELARLSEKKEAWAEAASYRSRLASLTPDAHARAQIHVATGDLLSPADRDPLGARLQYERAVAIDPLNAAAWEALQRDAEREHDDARRARCLEQRVKCTESGRLKAQLLVDLAKLLAETDPKGSFAAYEKAAAADPTNEAAATAVLPVYANDERWAEASPLCDLLVNAAARDGNKNAEFQLLRLATRIACATEDDERSMVAALLAHERQPGDVVAREELLEVCRHVLDKPALLGRAKSAITVISSDVGDLSTTGLVRLAEVQRKLGSWEQALDTFQRVLSLDPVHAPALSGLIALFEARADWEHACTFKVKLAQSLGGTEESYKLLVEAGEMWSKRAKNVAMSARVFEEALTKKPRDRSVLHALLPIYGELRSWEKLVETLRAVVDTEEDPRRKAKGVFAMAQAVRDEVKDLSRAATLFEEVIAFDPTRLDAFERVVRIYTERKAWDELERSYRRMLHRAKDPDGALRYQLFHQLGLIYRDRLADADRAIEAFRAAADLKPESEKDRKILNELYVVTNRLPEAVSSTRLAMEKAPDSHALYSELYDLSLRQRAFDRSWCAVNVLSYLGKVTAEQARFFQNYPPFALSDIPGSVPESAWASHMLHSDLDPVLTEIFTVMTGVVTRVHLDGISAKKHAAMLGEALRPDHAHGAAALLGAFKNASEILSCVLPQLHVRKGTGAALTPAMARKPSLLVNLDAAGALSPEGLAFLVGKRIAELRPDLVARTFFPTVTELAAVVTTAFRLSTGEQAHDAVTQKSDAALTAAMTPAETEALRHAMRHASQPGVKLDVKRWAQLVDLTTSRAGLLLCGHLDIARRAMLHEPQAPCDLRPRERVEALCLFAVSDTYCDLRRSTGISVDKT